MSTTLSTPSNTLAKIRFQEQYVSEGLNKKFNGVIPRGVIRGGLLVSAGAGFNVRVDADPVEGDSVYSYIDANGHQLTFRQVGNVTLDLTTLANTNVFIAAFIDYTTSAATVVEWRAYSEAEILTAPVAEAPYVIIVGKVSVPAAGPIPASDITPVERREAWDALSRSMVGWHQIVENGRFDLALTGDIITGTAEHIVGWTPTGGILVRTWSISTAAPRSGPHELQVDGGAGVTDVETIFGIRRWAVEPGTKVRVRFYCRGAAWTGITAGGVQGIQLTWYDTDMQSLSTTDVNDDSLSGTFGYTLIDEIVEAPASAAFVGYDIVLDPNGASPTGDFFFDDVRVWVQSDAPLEEDLPTRQAWDPIRARHLDIPPAHSFTTIDEMLGQTLRMFMAAKLGAPTPDTITYILQRLGAADPFILDLLGGYLKFRGTALVADQAELARIDGEVAATAVSAFSLIMEWSDSDTTSTWRFYHEAGATSSFVLTLNAKFTGGVWKAGDNTAIPALKYTFSVVGVLIEGKDAVLPGGGWADGAWDNITFRLDIIAGPVTNMALQDGRVEFQSPTTSASNTTSGLVNTLYAKNIVEAWFKAAGTTLGSAGSATINVTSLVANGLAVDVTFDHAAVDADSHILAGLKDGTIATAAGFLTADGYGANTVTIYAWVWSGAAIVQQDLTSGTADWGLLRMAEN
jgi:hypothetical protein